MANIVDVVQSNPLKSLAAFVGSASIILAAVFGFDDRYAHAGDLLRYQNQVQSQLTEYRMQDLENRVFELELRKGNLPATWTPSDEAILGRYKRQLMGTKQQNFQLQQQPVPDRN